MIIFGTRAKTKTIDQGEFYCPHCAHTRHYERKEIKNYFALYFIPLVPMGESGEIIECQTCGRSYTPEVLERKLSKPQPDVARLLNTVRARLQKNQPVEYVISDLTMQGYDRDVALNVVNMAIGEMRRQCPKCELTYARSAQMCPDCMEALQDI
jgi:ssDNA-binding Zn-finger/Zn-ribbon topoisomerase 1